MILRHVETLFQFIRPGTTTKCTSKIWSFGGLSCACGLPKLLHFRHCTSAYFIFISDLTWFFKKTRDLTVGDKGGISWNNILYQQTVTFIYSLQWLSFKDIFDTKFGFFQKIEVTLLFMLLFTFWNFLNIYPLFLFLNIGSSIF